MEKLKEQIWDMQLEIDILKETLNVLKKDPGVDWTALKNREKTAVIDAMRKMYPLSVLLAKMKLSKSSYYYQESLLSSSNKYLDIRMHIIRLFKENKKRYGYRRIHGELSKQGICVSEKVIQRIMKEESLTVNVRRFRKYNSYQGEISPAAPNIIEQDFHAEQPNQKWLTDITEFAIPAGKVYLSPIVDCFDGLIPSWTIGTSPNAELVNTMLDKAVSLLAEGEHPIIHSDRGCHYRWPEWIKRAEAARLIRSMSRKGCSPDNAACEGLFGRLKNEIFYGQGWSETSIEEFIRILDQYLHWYNETRIKVSLGNMSPLEYRHSLGLTA